MNMKLAKMIDHTLLKPTATAEQIKKLCSEAKEFGFASVCINPCYVPMAADMLKETDVRVCTVIGFPLGSSTTKAKIFEAQDAIENGAVELDYVLNVGDVLDDRYELVRQEMVRFAELRKKYTFPVLIKIILETCYLSEEQIVKVSEMARETGIDFVKTSTGFGTGGATIEQVRLMRETVGPEIGVKASGGIRERRTAEAMVQAGASRIGTSSGVEIVSGT